jgi:L-asparaginase / beta-aspartyl-peptidase
MPEFNQDIRNIALAVHGGAGSIHRDAMTPAAEADYRAGLECALLAGYRLLAAGSGSVDAVTAAVSALEDNPLFNAGKGAVFTHDGRIELDAAIMDGHSGQAGAVAGVTSVKNPVRAARAVMEQSRHVLLIGAGADQFAAAHGLDIVDQAYFFSQQRWDQLQKIRHGAQLALDHDGQPAQSGSTTEKPPDSDEKFGTVGAVARDGAGNLAAATSTGGLTNKLFGRVGDSAIIGAGTYAENASAAISGTGIGEYFMRGLLAHDIAVRIKYAGASLAQAVEQAIATVLAAKGGEGGVIALDCRGAIQFGFNTEGMFRGAIRSDGRPQVQMYRD